MTSSTPRCAPTSWSARRSTWSRSTCRKRRRAATRTSTPPRRSRHWTLEGVLTADREEALWALEQEYEGPDGSRHTRRGFLCRVRVTDYGPGMVRPHERTQPGPKEDRLRLTQATRHNLSPIFSLHEGNAWPHLAERHRRRALGRGHRRRRHGEPHLAHRGPRSDRGRPARARAVRAPDRGRPSPLRDRAHLRRPGRRRRRAPLHADGARLARGSRA